MRKKFRPQVKNKLLLLLVLLLTAATGAWATDVYVVGNGNVDGNWVNGAIWDPGVAGNKMTEQNGVYSITFKDVDANSELLFKFAINGSWDVNYGCISTDANELNKTLSNIDATGGMNFLFGLTEKADVTISFNLSEMTYMISTKGMKVGDDAATGYTVSLKDGVKDADKWTVKVGEGQAQALPIGGLKGDGSETVTLQYTGRLKVKGVKATSDAAAEAGKTVDLSTLSADYEAQNGDVLTGVTSSYKVTIAAGATVTLDGVNIGSSGYCIKCLGEATIILKDGSTNTLTSTAGDYPALSIGDANTTLTIQGSTGVLNVTSGQYCAGIGGGYANTNKTCGNIRIEGGVITAQGGYNGAGIGSDSYEANCGDIIITGGTITAKGGTNAAGIGTGYGSGNPAVCGAITIANTVTKVTATKGDEYAPHSIGKGNGDKASCGTVTIGGTKYWENNAAVNGGDTYLATSPLIYDPTAPSVPDGALSGKFSVSATKQVYFSKGNLRYASGAWSFFDNQYDYYTSYSADAWDKFGWSTFVTTYGMKTSTTNGDYYGDFVDWGATMGAGWFTLTSDEWTYLFNTRESGSTVFGTENARYTQATINTDGTGVNGVILFPDGVTIANTEVSTAGTVNGASAWGTQCTNAQWTALESKGCVFLPAAIWRYGTSMVYAVSSGRYWTGTASDGSYAYSVIFSSSSLSPAASGDSSGRCYGYSVRLVREVATSDAEPAKEPATVTTAPTGAAIVGVGKTTALVSGGAADGGTLRYAVTTTNTKPTSTDGFSDAVPTAEDITASGKVYVWYYVKADDTHTDSEIAATAIEVPVADIVWDATNVSDLDIDGTDEYEMHDVKLSGNAGDVNAKWTNGIEFETYESGGFTFTAPTGKAFTKIEMNAVGPEGWQSANLGTGWAFVGDFINGIYTVKWTGSAASTVGLLTGDDDFGGAATISYIAFYLSE